MAESFSGILKSEPVHHQRFKGPQDTLEALFEYIEDLLQPATATFDTGLSDTSPIKPDSQVNPLVPILTERGQFRVQSRPPIAIFALGPDATRLVIVDRFLLTVVVYCQLYLPLSYQALQTRVIKHRMVVYDAKKEKRAWLAIHEGGILQ